MDHLDDIENIVKDAQKRATALGHDDVEAVLQLLAAEIWVLRSKVSAGYVRAGLDPAKIGVEPAALPHSL